MLVATGLTPTSFILTDVSVAFGVSSQNPLSYAAEVVAGEVYNVLSTLVGDEPEEALYGSNIPLYAFALFTPATEQKALTDVFRALKQNVPHVSLSMADSSLLVSPDNRVLGITVGIKFIDEFFTVSLDLSGAYSG